MILTRFMMLFVRRVKKTIMMKFQTRMMIMMMLMARMMMMMTITMLTATKTGMGERCRY